MATILRMMSQQTVIFKQYPTELVTKTEPVRDYIDFLVLHLNKSTGHSYMTAALSNYLRILKETLPENEILPKRSFSGNVYLS